ncbi:MAG TPA: hypothetical protein EYQ53_06785 [Candidatus Poseidoniales archaeon]|nr:hypothetical protein [Candidatus Poseidoniales archaeon]HIK77960.1 hypothetical protein [Candidatus Poseidoniales archaeon]
MEESELPPIPDLPDSIIEDKDGSLVEDVQVGQIQRFSMLDDDIQGLRTLIAALSFVAILLTAAVVGVTLRNWLQDEIDAVASEQLKTRAAKYDALVQFDQVGDFTGDGVLVCIVDSGIDLTHPDINHVTLRGWKDFIGNNPNPYDDHGHGTAMAGILVADGQLVGKARGVGLLVAKALGGEGQGSDEGVANAIDWCVSEGAEVISLSLGGAPGILPAQFQGDGAAASARAAVDQGVFVIAAAGNDGQDQNDDDVDSPGSEENVICVGGVNDVGSPWVGSSKGDNNGRFFSLPIILPRNDPDKKPELVAPAERVPIVMIGGGWGVADGTSAATVYVSGAIALLLEGRPDLQRNGSAGGQQAVEDVKLWIQQSVKPRDGQDGHDEKYGYGLLQVAELIDRAGAQVPE